MGGGPGPSSFGRQQRLSEITIEPITVHQLLAELLCLNYPEKFFGEPGKIWGASAPSGPNVEPPLDLSRCVCACRFVSANAWNLAEVGFGVTGLVVAGLAVGRYLSLLLQLMPSFHRLNDHHATNSVRFTPFIGFRTTPPSNSTSCLP